VFSFLAADTRDVTPFALDLMGYATFQSPRNHGRDVRGAVPSDVPHLVRFYKQHFRRQGSFPIFERAL